MLLLTIMQMNRFRITRLKSELDINSLRHVDEFDIFMMRLDRAFCDITDIMDYEVIPTDELSKCEPFCYSMPLTDTYIKLNEMEVVGNVYDNPELLEECNE